MQMPFKRPPKPDPLLQQEIALAREDFAEFMNSTLEKPPQEAYRILLFADSVLGAQELNRAYSYTMNSMKRNQGIAVKHFEKTGKYALGGLALATIISLGAPLLFPAAAAVLPAANVLYMGVGGTALCFFMRDVPLLLGGNLDKTRKKFADTYQSLRHTVHAQLDKLENTHAADIITTMNTYPEYPDTHRPRIQALFNRAAELATFHTGLDSDIKVNNTRLILQQRKQGG